MAELSDQQTQRIESAVNELLSKLKAIAIQLRDKPDADGLKRHIADKVAFFTRIATLMQLGAMPTEEDLQEAREILERNMPPVFRIFDVVVEELKSIVQSVIDALTQFKDFIVSLFPGEETETTMLGDRLPERGEYAAFATVPGVGDNIGVVRLPVGFAGIAEPMTISFKPKTVRLSARFEDGGRAGLSCVEISDFAAISEPLRIRHRQLPPMLQTLDPRFKSSGMYNADTGDFKARMYTRAFDGHVYTQNLPIVITTDVSGKLLRGAMPTLQALTRSIDFVSDAPLREYVC